MYGPISSVLFEWMKLPKRPPDPPLASEGGYRTVRVFRASPRWLTYRMILYWIGAAMSAIGLFVVGVGTFAAGKHAVAAFVILGALIDAAAIFIGWFCVRFEYDLRTYIVTDRSLRVRQGAWVFKEITLTYANVQNVQVLQGPLQRLFGIEDLRVDTAGGGGKLKGEGAGTSGHQVTLAGLENAHEVRDLILAYVKEFTRGSGLGDLDDPEHAPAGRSSADLRAPEVLVALKELRASAASLRRAAEART